MISQRAFVSNLDVWKSFITEIQVLAFYIRVILSTISVFFKKKTKKTRDNFNNACLLKMNFTSVFC